MKKRFATEFTPRFSDFDLQGILNSKCYVDFLAEARLQQMTKDYGLSIDYYAKKNETWVFSNLDISFLRPIQFGFDFKVETEVIAIEGSKAVVDFEFRAIDRDIVFANGKASYVLVNLETKRPVAVSQAEIDVFLSRTSERKY